MQASSDKVPEKRSAHHPVLAVELNFDAERQSLLRVFDEVRRKGVNLDVDVFQEGVRLGPQKRRLLGVRTEKQNGKALFKLPH